jgi:ferric-chelate reductase [NAD(P)H]
MYIVSSVKDGKPNGQIANTVFQITSVPATIAISINKKNLTHEFIESSRAFSISILDETAPLQFIGKFGFKSGRNEDKFKDINFKLLGSGCPAVLDNSICCIDAKVVDCFGCGTHTLFIGQMTDSEMLKTGKPMTYEYYHLVKKGTTPRSAPTFISGEKKYT